MSTVTKEDAFVSDNPDAPTRRYITALAYALSSGKKKKKSHFVKRHDLFGSGSMLSYIRV